MTIARAVGRAVARIQGYSAARPELAAQFSTDSILFDIRLEPYHSPPLGATPTWRRRCSNWSQQLKRTR